MLSHESAFPTLANPDVNYFVCQFQGCNKRRIVCGNKNHLEDQESQTIEYRYNKARQAGIAETALTQVLEAREALFVFEQGHMGELLQCQVGALIDTEGPLDPTSTLLTDTHSEETNQDFHRPLLRNSIAELMQETAKLS